MIDSWNILCLNTWIPSTKASFSESGPVLSEVETKKNLSVLASSTKLGAVSVRGVYSGQD